MLNGPTRPSGEREKYLRERIEKKKGRPPAHDPNAEGEFGGEESEVSSPAHDPYAEGEDGGEESEDSSPAKQSTAAHKHETKKEIRKFRKKEETFGRDVDDDARFTRRTFHETDVDVDARFTFHERTFHDLNGYGRARKGRLWALIEAIEASPGELERAQRSKRT